MWPAGLYAAQIAVRLVGLCGAVIGCCGAWSSGAVVLFGSLLALPIEALTAWLRFGLGLQSSHDTDWVAALAFGIRIHHGYIGILMALVAWWLLRHRLHWRNLLCAVAIALIVSDLAHHFLVLWPVTGSPQWDLVYPPGW